MATLARTATGPEELPCSPGVARILLKEPNASNVSGLVTKGAATCLLSCLKKYRYLPVTGVSKVFQSLCF